jgi:hypothetical protein
MPVCLKISGNIEAKNIHRLDIKFKSSVYQKIIKEEDVNYGKQG